MVVGSDCLFPLDGLLTKYEAPYDQRACFDGGRWSFLVVADPQMQVNTFRRKLQSMIERADADVLLHIAEFDVFLDALRACDTLLVESILPIQFEARAWNAYVNCLQENNYRRYCEEVLFLCLLGNISVAIFELQGRELGLAASYIPVGTTPVLIIIDSLGDTG